MPAVGPGCIVGYFRKVT